MTLTSWITALAMGSTVTVAGAAFAQQPTPPPKTTPDPVTTRGTGVGMTNPATTEGKPITVSNLPTVDRITGVGMTNPATPEGKPLTQSTNFGSR